MPRAPAYKRPAWVVLGLATPGIVVGSYALGPASPFVAAAAIVLLVLLIRTGPSVNDRLYGGPRPEGAQLTAGGLRDHRSGRVVITPDAVRWSPYKATSNTNASPWTVSATDVSMVELRARGGPQRSVELVVQLHDGAKQDVRVFAGLSALEAALR